MSIRSKSLINSLIQKGVTISVAESCTGGQIASEFTSHSGVSESFMCGLVTYSNESKQRVLGVFEGALNTHGAVSHLVAEQMARRVREIGMSDIGVSTTGIAGPGGGTNVKPVGTVYIGVSTKESTKVRKHTFKGTRAEIQKQAVDAALDLIEKFLRYA